MEEQEKIGIHNDRRIDDIYDRRIDGIDDDLEDLNWAYIDDYSVDISNPIGYKNRKR